MTNAKIGQSPAVRALLVALVGAAALLSLALPGSASAAFASGQQEIWSAPWGGGKEEFYDPSLFGVDPVTGHVFVSSTSVPGFTPTRIEEFTEKGVFVGETAPIPSRPAGLVGIAVDHHTGEFYVLETEEEFDEELEQEFRAAKQILAFKITPAGSNSNGSAQLPAAEVPSLPVPPMEEAHTVVNSRELVLDPKSHELIISGEDHAGKFVLQRIKAEGAGGVGARYEETGSTITAEDQVGVAVDGQGKIYVVAGLGPQTTVRAYTLPSTLASTLSPVPGFAAAAGNESWPSGTENRFIAEPIPGRFGQGSQIAVSSSSDGSGETLYFKTTKQRLNSTTPGAFFVRGYSLAEEATSVVFGGGSEGECAIQSGRAGLATLADGSLMVLDQGEEVSTGTPAEDFYPEVVRFGREAGEFSCPVPAAAFKTEAGGGAVTSVHASTNVTLNGSTTELSGQTLSETVWKVEGPESFTESVSGPADTLTHSFAAEGTYTIRMKIKTSDVTAIGTTFTAVPRNLVVTAASPTPTVSGVSPNKGTPGTEVTISGTGLTGATAVKFGGENATGTISVNGAGTEITGVMSPAACTAGTVDVTVTTPAGTSSTGSGDRFTCEAAASPTPTVSGVSPNKGPAVGGTSVSITGQHLTGATAVKFGAVAASGTISVNGAGTEITGVMSPAGVAGTTVDVTVVTPGGTSTASAGDKFEYEAAVPVDHSLMIHTAGTGSGSVKCNGGACASGYQQGTEVTLSAAAASGSTFAGWSGGGCVGTGSCTVKLNSDTIITATFNAQPTTPTQPSNTVNPGTFKQHGSTATLAATVPGPGTVSASGKGIAATKTTAKGAGTVQLKLKLTAAAKKTLAMKGKLTVKVKVSFTPVGGTAGTATKTITFKAGKAHAKGSALAASLILHGLF